MRIYIANDSEQGLGGGWSFISNLRRGMYGLMEEVETPEESDVVLLPSSSMVHPPTVARAKAAGKKIVLRVDNMPRNSRNRNTGSSRLLSYATDANAIVFQSKWASDFIGDWLYSNLDVPPPLQTIIYNGVDRSVFTPEGERIPRPAGVAYLYSRYNRDETKQWHVMWYEYIMRHRLAMEKGGVTPTLWLVGRFADDLRENNFDFFQGEDVKYLGVMQDAHSYAKILRSADVLLAPYYNDACSNTIIEALCCGLYVDTCGYGYTGGTPEIMNKHKEGFDWSCQRMAKEYHQLFTQLL